MKSNSTIGRNSIISLLALFVITVVGCTSSDIAGPSGDSAIIENYAPNSLGSHDTGEIRGEPFKFEGRVLKIDPAASQIVFGVKYPDDRDQFENEVTVTLDRGTKVVLQPGSGEVPFDFKYFKDGISVIVAGKTLEDGTMLVETIIFWQNDPDVSTSGSDA
jgi:hypothetical protein